MQFAGWQLTEVDEPYQEAAAAARQAQASAIRTPAVAQGLTGGDPDAVMHPTETTEVPHPDASQSTRTLLHSDPPLSSTPSSSSSSRGLANWARQKVASFWMSMLMLISTAISRVLYFLNSRFSSMDFPPWALHVMSSLAHGPMKKKLLHLYAEAGDHSRRLSSVLANGKFSSIQAGPDEPWEVCQTHVNQQNCNKLAYTLWAVA